MAPPRRAFPAPPDPASRPPPCPDAHRGHVVPRPLSCGGGRASASLCPSLPDVIVPGRTTGTHTQCWCRTCASDCCISARHITHLVVRGSTNAQASHPRARRPTKTNEPNVNGSAGEAFAAPECGAADAAMVMGGRRQLIVRV